ncbi:RNA-directed DNA polymerase from mobile element jockey [Plakobranchus ocellatus]|uniref:RNA-directed DNA polymerase from mobile element jockey n=1 Tax=Plakobranchus ocellatus TaxID=259542 RepID=A0AAV3ZF12_9GAST|nr:RNA-directed DNA polymerase from mobile element jockey [Plakobranchus ocellatus]
MTELKNSIVKSNESAVGPDDVYYQFLKHLPESCLHTLLKLFNNIWTTGDIPPSWREASVVPIPKPGKDPSDPSNYRPIALTSCLCKTLERMVNDRLVHVLESRNLLSKVQCGFRKDDSTLDHLWVSDNGFRFSVSKTTCVHFHRQRIYTEPALHLDGQPIPVKDEAKFLGVIFDQKLSFENHVKYLKNKCFKALNLLPVVGHTDWGADRATLLKFYRTLVRSKLDYGSVIYGCAKKHVLRNLDPIHHQGLRIALGAFRTLPFKTIDLAVASPSIAAESSWAAHSDLCGSDHFPIFLTLSSHFNGNTNTTFNFKKCRLERFGDVCKLSLDDSVADIEQFTSKLLDAARSSIPFHKGAKNKTRVPWFTQDCRQALGKGKRLKGSILKRLLLKIL